MKATARTQAPVKPREPFPTSLRAQVWYEVRRAVWPALVIAPGFVVALLPALMVLGAMEPDEFYDSVSVWLLLSTAAILFAAVIAADLSTAVRKRGGIVRLPAFDATLPLGDGRLALIKTVTVATVMAGATAILTVVFALWTFALNWQGTWEGLERMAGEIGPEFDAMGVAGRVALALSVLLALGSVPPLLLAAGLWVVKRPEAVLAGAGVVFAYMLLGMFAQAFHWDLRAFRVAHVYALSAAVVFGVAWASAQGLRLGYVDKRLYAAVFAVWLTTGILWMVAPERAGLSASDVGNALPLLGAAFTLPLAAPALPPLALARHRHL